MAKSVILLSCIIMFLISCTTQQETTPTAQDIISHPEKYEGQEIEIEAYTYTPIDGVASDNTYGSVRILGKPYDSSTKREEMLLLAYGQGIGSPGRLQVLSIYGCNETNKCYGSFLYECVNKKTNECKGWKDNGKYRFKGKIERDPNPLLTETRFVFAHFEYEEVNSSN